MATTVKVRVVRDGVGNVLQGGETIHSNVRAQKDTTGRWAVWVSGTGEPPSVYEADSVEFVMTRKPCSCKGDVAKMRLAMLWPS